MNSPESFNPLARVLHWLMAVMILAMLFIGVSMVVSIKQYNALLSIHKPLGIAIFALAMLRLLNRSISTPPALPASLPKWQKLAAHASHLTLYVLMVALPLVGWAMQSAGHYPVALGSGWHLPPILSPDPALYSKLRTLHTLLAYLLFGTFLAHFGAALTHALIFRDGVFEGMVWSKTYMQKLKNPRA